MDNICGIWILRMAEIVVMNRVMACDPGSCGWLCVSDDALRGVGGSYRKLAGDLGVGLSVWFPKQMSDFWRMVRIRDAGIQCVRSLADAEANPAVPATGIRSPPALEMLKEEGLFEKDEKICTTGVSW